jgi:hypothetical protein
MWAKLKTIGSVWWAFFQWFIGLWSMNVCGTCNYVAAQIQPDLHEEKLRAELSEKCKEIKRLQAEKQNEVNAHALQLEFVRRPTETVSKLSQTPVNMTGLNGNSVHLRKAEDCILKMNNKLMKKQKCMSELQTELHSLRQQMKKYIQEKGKTIHSLQNKLCVQKMGGKEAHLNNSATIQVKLEAMAAQNNSLQKDKELLLSAKDFLKKDNEYLKRENMRLLEECERLHSIEEEANILRQDCVAMEDRFRDVSAVAKELETEKNRCKRNREECAYLQQQVSSLQLSLEEANREKELLEKQAKRSQSTIAYQEALIKCLKRRICMDTGESKEPAEREGSQSKNKLNVAYMEEEKSQVHWNELVQMEESSITEETPVTEVIETHPDYRDEETGTHEDSADSRNARFSVGACNRARSKKKRLSEYIIPSQLEQLPQDNLSLRDHTDQKMADMLSSFHNLFRSGIGPNEHNYGDYFHNLVCMEEHADRKKMKRYNMANVSLKIISKKQLQLHVPALDELHPFVRKGDLVYLQVSLQNCEREESIKYRADIEKVINKSISLAGFLSKLIIRLQENSSMCFDVEFTSNRFPPRAMHRAIDLLLERDMLHVVFPPDSSLPALPVDEDIQFINPLIQSNPEQQTAVRNILLGTSYPSPYIIFGPPGTG